MPPTRSKAIGTALLRFKATILACCWITGIALATQTVIWSLAMFTDLRYAEPARPVAKTPTVIRSSDVQHVTPRAPAGPAITPAETGAVDVNLPIGVESVPQRALNENDHHLRTVVIIASQAGTMAMLALLSLVATGLILCAGSATPGIERTVSAMVWSIVTALLLLPMGEVFPQASLSGAFADYDAMSKAVEAARGDVAVMGGSAMFYARYFFMPVTCVVGVILVGLRFSGGVEAAMIPQEPVLDPALEAEVARIKPGTLHGSGRASIALRGTVADRDSEHAMPAIPSATKVSPGSMPRRLI